MLRPIWFRAITASLAVTAACASPPAVVADSPSPQGGTFSDSVQSGTATLLGTLLVPANTQPPVALIIAGSGPTDRDGNSPLLAGKNNSLRYLAEKLAKQGIASLRYDKRWIGASRVSTGSIEDVRFYDLVDDAVTWGRRLAADRRFSSVVIIGHSEGSLLGMLAAPRIPARKMISVAGAGLPAGEVIIRQLRAQLPPPLLAEAEAAVRKLERGEDPDSISPVLARLFQPSVLPYMKSWFSHDPRIAIARLGVPTLIVQGTHDIQASAEDAQALAAARPSATLTMIPGMNHVLKQTAAGRAEQMRFYSDSTAVVDPQLVDAIVRFIRGS